MANHAEFTLTDWPPLQLAKERREAKEKRQAENKMKGLQYQVVSMRAVVRRYCPPAVCRRAAQLVLPPSSLFPSLPCAPRRQISDSRKIKKMSRKQLKLIHKADTTGEKPLLAAEKKRKK